MQEIASMMDRDETRNRVTIARDARLELAMFNIEVEAPDSEDEEQEHAHNIWGEGHKVNTAENDEEVGASDTDSIETVEYEKEDTNDQEKLGPVEEHEEIIMTSEDEEKDTTKEAVKVTNSAKKTNAERGLTSPLQRQNVIEIVSTQKSPPRRRSGSGTRSPPASPRRSPTSSPRLRS